MMMTTASPILKDQTGMSVQPIAIDDAYHAAKSGQIIVARCISNSTNTAFELLKDVPASAFFEPDDWQFAIKIDTITINSHEFTKPLLLSELVVGQDIYFVGATNNILKGQFIENDAYLMDAANTGCLQRDEANARLQLIAIKSQFGIHPEIEVVDYDFGGNAPVETKKRRSRKSKDEQLDAVKESNSDVGQKTDSFFDEMVATIENAQTLDALNQISNQIITHSRNLSNDDLDILKEQYAQREHQLSQLDLLTADQEYQKTLEDLVARAKEAKSVKEANDLVAGTTSWTPEQREPLLSAVHNRIIWLNGQSQPPSLMVQIQQASDLDVFETLKQDILKKPIIIQPELMTHYHARRNQLLGIGMTDD